MTRVVAVAGMVAVSVTSLWAQDGLLGFRAEVTISSVQVDVAVTRRGRPVTGLGLNDFALLDSGVVQQPVSLSFDTLPIDVTVALDVSSSVQGAALRDLSRAIDQLQKRLRPDDRIKLLTFNDRIQRLVDFTDPRVDANQMFGRIVPSGGTALFDALAVALSSPTVADRRHIVIMFSDGEDSASAIEPETLVAVARRSTPALAFVLSGAVPSALRTRPAPGDVTPERLFATLAAETGGVVISAAVASEVASTFNRILDDFRSVYVLHYTPTGVPASGFHPLTVRVTRSGEYDVRARRGYMGE